MQDYKQRLRRLTSLQRVFDEYASVELGHERFMTSGDLMRAMLCYRFTRIEPKELKRRCGRYVNPLLGDNRGLIGMSEFVFLVELLAIPAEFFHVALAALDADGNGTIDQSELDALVSRLLQPSSSSQAPAAAAAAARSSSGSVSEAAGAPPPPRPSKRLTEAWFGPDGGGHVCGAEVEAFVRALAKDVRAAELRLYSRFSPHVAAKEEGGSGGSRGGWNGWVPWRWLWRLDGAAAAESGGDVVETLSTGDLALTLVSSCDPRRLPVLLERVANVRRRRVQVPVDEALRLHDAMESRSEDLAYTLSLFSSANQTGGTSGVGSEDFARAIRVVTGTQLRPELVDLVFDLFDEEGDGKLGVAELIDALKTRGARRLGIKQPPPGLRRFVECVRSGGQ